jgi:hypothetical protein
MLAATSLSNAGSCVFCLLASPFFFTLSRRDCLSIG